MPTNSISRRVAIGLALMVALLGVSGATVASSEVACSSCHAMNTYAESAADSQHASVGCRSCHGAGAEASLALTSDVITRMVPAWLGGADVVSGPGTRVPGAACLECHAEVLGPVTETRGLRIDHAACVGETGACDQCHSASTHAQAVRYPRQAAMEECVLCHEQSGAPTDCDLCHEGKLESERLAQGPWQVTHGPQWRQTHGAGTLQACMTCHPDDYCVDCHGMELPHPVGFGLSHGAAALPQRDACLGCHDSEGFCAACHGMDMPHPDGFLAEHPELTEPDSDASCLRCHRAADCEACHVLHTHPGNTEGTIGGEES